MASAMVSTTMASLDLDMDMDEATHVPDSPLMTPFPGTGKKSGTVPSKPVVFETYEEGECLEVGIPVCNC